MTRQEISHLVATDPAYAVAALLAINTNQTIDEQQIGATQYQNGVGFNGVDAPFFSALIDFYRAHQFLTPRQLMSVRKHLPKYFKQIDGCDLQPAPFRTQNLEPIKKTPSGNQKQAKVVQDNLVISFPYDASLVAKVKTLNKRSWNATEKHWTAPICMETVQKLKEWEFEVDERAIRWLNELTKPAETNTTQQSGTVPELQRPLFPYQLQGIQFIESRNGRALVGDEMGLGKTVQALGWLQLHPESRPAVIVVPATLKLNWLKEIGMWMTGNRNNVHIITGKYKPGTDLPQADIYIINYDILAEVVGSKMSKGAKVPTYGCRSDIISVQPKVLITDECHQFKNSDAQRTKAIKDLAKKVPHVLALSGTPIVNRPVEMFNALSIIEPKLFPSFFRYAQRYCGAKHNGFGWDFNGATNTEELHKILTETIMIRRLKANVLKELPSKIRTAIPIELSNQKEYQRAEQDFIGWVRETFGKNKAQKAMCAEALTRIGELKRLAIRGKMNACIEWIREFLESGEKLVVFAVHKFVIEQLMEVFGDIAVKIDGSVSTEQRQAAVEAFQNDPSIKIFVGNVKAAGVGITLTKASSTCFLELEWTPGIHDQAEDRVHRIGQEADSVNAYYLLAAGTMEEEIALLIDKKRQVLSQVLDGKDVDEESMLSELLNKYNN